MIALAAVLAALILLCLLPVGVLVCFDRGELTLRVLAGPAGFNVYPPREPDYRKLAKKSKKKQVNPKKAKEKKQEKPKKEKPKKKLSLDFIRSLAALALDFLGGLRRKLLVRELTLHLIYGGADAAETAVGYGRAWAILGAAVPVLENTFRIRRRDVQAVLDWSEPSVQCCLRMEIRIRIGGVLALALRAGVRFLKILIQNKKKAVQTT